MCRRRLGVAGTISRFEMTYCLVSISPFEKQMLITSGTYIDHVAVSQKIEAGHLQTQVQQGTQGRTLQSLGESPICT